MVIDDGSQEVAPLSKIQSLIQGQVSEIKILTLTHNVGHQKAIALGLSYISKELDIDGAIIMDADGEDPPHHIPALINRSVVCGKPIVVAQRGKRFENLRFRFLYYGFRTFFRVITGHTIDFGNYSFISKTAIDRVVRMPELLGHYPATLIKSRMSIDKITLDRGQRYAGQSRMDLASLILHAFGGTSVFIDRVFIRLLIGLGVLLTLSLSTIAIVIGMKIFTVPTPGWTTTVVGTQVLIIFQAFAFVFASLLISLSSKRSLNQPATSFTDRLIETVVTLKQHTKPEVIPHAFDQRQRRFSE